MSIGLGGVDTATDQWSLGLDHISSTMGTTIVVAAGNDGPASSSFSGPPATAFNVLSVGATGGTGAVVTENYGQVAPYSSRGPTSDGRSKPDIVAPGSLIELPTLGGAWAVGSGTSFAAPLVAGGAALLVDMGRDRGLDADALVIKSVLMNSADKLTGWTHSSTAPLDPNQGVGQMNLESAFHQYDAGEWGLGTVGAIGWDHGAIVGSTDNTYGISPTVPAGVNFTSTLVWNRNVSTNVENIETAVYTAAPLANLDLFLYEAGDLSTPVATSMSMVDNVEHLFLSIPQQGQYVLQVHSAGGSLVDPLSYSLAWYVDVPEVTLLGDYNENDVVDAADYTVWRDALTAGSTSLTNDPTPGAVDESDFAYWRAHFGETLGSGSGSAASAAVPEPSGLALALFALLSRIFLVSSADRSYTR